MMNDTKHPTLLRLRSIVLTVMLLLATAVPVVGQSTAPPPSLGFTRDFEYEAPAGPIFALAAHDDGSGPQLYVGGQFHDIIHHLPFTSRNIVRWDGSTWSNVGVVGGGGVYGGNEVLMYGEPGVHALGSFGSGPGSILFVGGAFSSFYSQAASAWLPCSGFVRWDGTDYTRDTAGRSIETMIQYDDGSGPALYAGGYWPNYIIRFDGSGWSNVGGFFIGPPPGSIRFQHMAVHFDGQASKLYVTGIFVQMEGPNGTILPAQGLASWDGVRWEPVAPPFLQPPGSVYSWAGLASFDDGNGPALFLSAFSNIWRNRGSGWESVLPDPSDPISPGINQMDSFDDGSGPALFVHGRYLHTPSMPTGQFTRFARFDGQTWTPMGQILQFSTGFDLPYCPASSAVFDFGQGPDLYRSTCYTIESGGDGGLAQGLTRYRGAWRDLSPVCGGDGSVQHRCPCGTRGDVGHGCPNSAVPAGARLTAQGVPANDTVNLAASSLPSTALCALFQGTSYDYGGLFAGDGVRCTTGTVVRLGMQSAQSGSASFPAPSAPSLRASASAHGDPLSAGSVRYYQVWYRDADPAFCTAGGLFNMTNGMRVVW